MLWVCSCPHYPLYKMLLNTGLDSRTTIKQYGLVRNQSLLAHDDSILHFSIKIGENCILNFYFKITVSEAHCHIINHWYSSLEAVFLISVHFDVTGTRNIFQGIWKCITLYILIQNVEISRMYSLYSAHVMSCHVTAVCLQNTMISTYLELSEIEIYQIVMWLLQQHIIMLAERLLWCLKSI